MNVDHRRAVILLLSLAMLATACGSQPHQAPADASGADGSEAHARASSSEQDGRRAAEQHERDAAVADLTREDADLVVWADEDRATALRPLAEAFGDDHGATVAVQALPLEQIRDQFQVAGPDGAGPDVLIGAHEWLGELVPAGMVAPLDLGDRAAGLEEVAVSAVTYGGRTYGVPYALSSVALLRDTRLVPTAPGSWEDLVETVRDLRQREAVPAGLVLPGDPYHLHPVVTASGGYLFGRGADGSEDVADLGIASPGSVEAARRLGEWAAEGVIEVVASSAEAQAQFLAGDAAFAILDPEAVGPDGGGTASDGRYAVSPVPPVEGTTARPFVRVEAVMVSAYAADAELARRFVLERLAADDGQATLAAATGRPPAHRAVGGAVRDAGVAGSAAAARDGVALPAVPETGSVWGPWADALEQVVVEGADPHQALAEAADEVRELIGN